MENTLLIGLSRQVTLERQMDVIANNVANVNTNGFKADRSLFQEFLSSRAREDNFVAGRDRRLSHVHGPRHLPRFRAGLARADQEPARRRDRRRRLLRGADPGRRALHPRRRVPDQQSGPARQRLRLSRARHRRPDRSSSRPTSEINIAADGNVTVLEGTGRVDSVRGKLRLVTFAKPQRLMKEGSNLYSPATAPPRSPTPTRQVRQGFVEKSNVNSVAEMSRMIEVDARLHAHRRRCCSSSTTCTNRRSTSSPTFRPNKEI